MQYCVLALRQMQEYLYREVWRTSVVLLQFRFYCLLPFITLPIVFVLKLSMYRSESAWSTSSLLIYKKASFCWTFSESILFKTKCRLSLCYQKVTTALLGLFCSSLAQNEGISLKLCLSQWSRIFLEKLLVAYVVKFIILFESTYLLTTVPYLSQMRRVYLSSYFFAIQLSC